MPIPFLNSITLNKNEIQEFKVYNLTPDPTLTSAGDYGYMWLNTSDSPKTLKWWDGTSIRSIVDSGNTSTLTVGTANDLSGGVAGSLPYQQGVGDTTFLGIGSSGYILTSTGSAPQWSASIPSSSVSGLAASATTDTTNASNISSGTLGLARLSLASGQFYVGDGSNNPAATAKSSIPLSGFGAAGADVAMGGFKITGLADPSAATDAATRGYVDSVAQGLDVKASCLVATTTDITLASPGAVTIDGIYSATDFTAGTTRILVKDQSAPAENGIYIWQGPSSAMTRSLDANTWDELVGAFTFIETGTANADSGWVCNVNAGGTLGTTAVTWTKFSQAGSYTAGNGMVLSGGVFHFAQSSAYTAGQIPFCSNSPTANSIGFSSNLFWDNSNNRLGIGTATVDGKVHIYGDTYANSQLRIQRNGAVNGTFSIGVAGTNNSLYIQDEVNATARLIIDGSGNLGLGAVSPSQRLFVQSASSPIAAFNSTSVSGPYLIFQSSGTSFGDIGSAKAITGSYNATDMALNARSAASMYFCISDVAKMVLDANGRLGIGTAPPAYPLDISASKAVSRLTSSTGTNGAFSFFSNTGGAFYIGLDNSAGTEFSAAYSGAIWHSGAYPIVFATSNAEKMRLDSSGNLALAATPSAWISAYRAIEIGATAGLYGRVDSTMELSLALNGYRDNSGAWVYRNNGAAALYNQNVGDHYWYTATAGTATNNISWGDAKMTLLASGNLGVGKTPNSRLHVYTASGTTPTGGDIQDNGAVISASSMTGTSFSPSFSYATTLALQSNQNSISAGTGASIGFQGKWESSTYGSCAQFASIAGLKENSSDSNYAGYLTFATRLNGGGPIERLRISSTGQALFSTNGTASAPTIANADNPDTGLYWPTDADTLALAVGGSDAVYIDSSRRVGIGISSSLTRTLMVAGGIELTSSTDQKLAWGISGSYLNWIECGGIAGANYMRFATGNTECLRIKSTGQINFSGLAADPTGAAGDLYYSTGNVLKMHNGTAWQQLSRKYSGALSGTGTSFTVTHNLGTRDVTVQVRKSGSTYDLVYTDVQMTTENAVTVIFASSVTGSDYTVTVIG